MSATIQSTQGYGYTLSCSGLSTTEVSFIEGQMPSVSYGFRETTTLANTKVVTYMPNKLKDYKEIEATFDIAYLNKIRAVMGTNKYFTLTIPGVYSFSAWGFMYEDDNSKFSGRTHDHDVQFTVKIKWTNVNESNTETEPTESFN